MTYVILGNCRCQGCGRMVYWGRTKLRSHAVGTPRWRNPDTHRIHYCKAGLDG